eukprot:NODE_90_length_21577_cov_0.697691.p2 type:complete len:844 gc:universal NODE_90_length_21577_cov_0.697691:3676-1145(-)
MSYLEISKKFQFSVSTANQAKLKLQFEEYKQSNFWRTFERYNFSSIAPFYVPSTPYPVASTNELVIIASVEELVVKARKRDKWYTLHNIAIDIDPFPEFAQIIIKDDSFIYINSLGHLKCYIIETAKLLYQVNVYLTLVNKYLTKAEEGFSRVTCPVHLVWLENDLIMTTYAGQLLWLGITYEVPLLQGIYELDMFILNSSIKDDKLNLITAKNLKSLQNSEILQLDIKNMHNLILEYPYHLDPLNILSIPTNSMSSSIGDGYFCVNEFVSKGEQKLKLKYSQLFPIDSKFLNYNDSSPLVMLDENFEEIDFISNIELNGEKFLSGKNLYFWNSHSILKSVEEETTLYNLIFYIFEYIISILLWQFDDNSRDDIYTHENEIYDVGMTTPYKIYESLLSSKNYGEALKMAEQLGISQSEVLKVQWQQTAVTELSITQLLSNIDDIEYRLQSSIQRVPNSLESCLLLIKYGLELLNTNEIYVDKFESILLDSQKRLKFLKTNIPKIPLNHIYDPLEFLNDSSDFSLYFSVFRSYSIEELMTYFSLTQQVSAYNFAVDIFKLSFSSEDTRNLLPISQEVKCAEACFSSKFPTTELKHVLNQTQNGIFLDFALSVNETSRDLLKMSDIELLAIGIVKIQEPLFEDILKELNTEEVIQVVKCVPFSPEIFARIATTIDPKILAPNIYKRCSELSLDQLSNFYLEPLFAIYKSEPKYQFLEILMLLHHHVHLKSKLIEDPFKMIQRILPELKNYFLKDLQESDYNFLLQLYSKIENLHSQKQSFLNSMQFFKISIVQLSLVPFCRNKFHLQYSQYLVKFLQATELVSLKQIVLNNIYSLFQMPELVWTK